jgi:diphthamide biosynthesis protein 7
MTIDAASMGEDGPCVIATITAKGELSIVSDWAAEPVKVQAHSPILESWSCALSPDTKLVGTGSDDCVLKIWDSRCLKEGPSIQNEKSHSMGVTCIEFLQGDSHHLLTGSYDDRIRRFDLRNLSQPVLERKTIGGVWRLKPWENDRLFVAACYGGCTVVRMDDFEPIVTNYTEHQSMAYGIGALSINCVVSCSFYDKLVQFWCF